MLVSPLNGGLRHLSNRSACVRSYGGMVKGVSSTFQGLYLQRHLGNAGFHALPSQLALLAAFIGLASMSAEKAAAETRKVLSSRLGFRRAEIKLCTNLTLKSLAGDALPAQVMKAVT